MVERLGWTLVHFVWEGTLIALILAVALAVFRNSARTRYALACAALAGLAVAPLATLRALLPSVPATMAQSGHTTFTVGERIVGEPAPYANLLPAIVDLWAVGVLVLSVRLVGTLLQVERWRRRHARPAEAAWQARIDVLARSLGIRRKIGLLVSDRIAVPSAWGVLKAVVVLPTSLLVQLSPAQVETILMHELAHIRRHDYLVNLLQAVVETALFYHPAVWWVSGVVRREREHCCDDAVVARLPDPMPYARALLHLEERRLALPRPTLSAKEGNLMNRIARILAPKPAPKRVSPLASSLAAAAVLASILGGTLQAQAQSKPAAKPKPKSTVTKNIPKIIRVVPVRTSKPTIKTVTLARVKPATAPPVVAAPMTVPSLTNAPSVTPVAAAPAVKANGKVPVLGDLPVMGKLFQTQPPKAAGIATVAIAEPVPVGTKRAEATTSQATTPSASPLAAGGLGGGTPAAIAGQGGFGGGTTGGFPARPGAYGGGGLGGGIPANPAFGGMTTGGFGRGFDPETDFTVDFNRADSTVSVDLKDTSLSAALRALARKAKMSVVIEGGSYGDLTMVLNDMPLEDALQILCRAANATYRHEDRVYFISPRGK